jgi:hypothetical protein
MSAKATGVEIPRKSIVSSVFRPTRPAPGTTRRGLFGVTGGTAFAPGDGLTAVVAVSGRLVTVASVGKGVPVTNVFVVTDTPQSLTVEDNRDRSDRTGLWVRRGLLALLGLFLVAGLLNVFGQRPATSSASVSGAKLSVYSPTRVRGGLYYEARFHIQAYSDIKDATLVLDTGWLEGMTINTIEPGPLSEGSRNGKLVLELGHVRAGQRHLLYMQLQVNPTNVGHRSQRVQLYDGNTLLTSVKKTITIFP